MNPEQAYWAACLAHRGQTDKCGVDYINHPVAVAAAVAELGEHFEVVALLHDVWEDTSHKLYGLTEYQQDALAAITRMPDERYSSYIERCKKNFIARVVKIADVQHNLSPARMSKLDPKEAESMTVRYEHTLLVLTSP